MNEQKETEGTEDGAMRQEMLTPRGVAAELKLPLRVVRGLLEADEIKHDRFAAWPHWRVRRDWLRDYVERQARLVSG